MFEPRIINRDKGCSFELQHEEVADGDAGAGHDLLRRRHGRRPDGFPGEYPSIRWLGQLSGRGRCQRRHAGDRRQRWRIRRHAGWKRQRDIKRHRRGLWFHQWRPQRERRASRPRLRSRHADRCLQRQPGRQRQPVDEQRRVRLRDRLRGLAHYATRHRRQHHGRRQRRH
ncbi:hypothetical protein D3C71_1423720 [compost metagenome]